MNEYYIQARFFCKWVKQLTEITLDNAVTVAVKIMEIYILHRLNCSIPRMFPKTAQHLNEKHCPFQLDNTMFIGKSLIHMFVTNLFVVV